MCQRCKRGVMLGCRFHLRTTAASTAGPFRRRNVTQLSRTLLSTTAAEATWSLTPSGGISRDL